MPSKKQIWPKKMLIFGRFGCLATIVMDYYFVKYLYSRKRKYDNSRPFWNRLLYRIGKVPVVILCVNYKSKSVRIILDMFSSDCVHRNIERSWNDVCGSKSSLKYGSHWKIVLLSNLWVYSYSVYLILSTYHLCSFMPHMKHLLPTEICGQLLSWYALQP